MEDPHVDDLENTDASSALEVPLLTEFQEQSSSYDFQDLDGSSSNNNDEGECNTDTSNDGGDTSNDGTRTKSGLMRGRIMLLFVSFLYGSMNVSYRLLYDGFQGPPSPSILNMIRGYMISFAFAPVLFCRSKTRHESSSEIDLSSTGATEAAQPKQPMWMVALQLSMLNGFSMIMAAIALTITPSARASFFGQTTVFMVPLISSFLGEKIQRKVWLGCAASIIGILILSQDGEKSSTNTDLRVGDLLNLGATFLWSCVIIRTSQVSSYYDEVTLQATKNIFNAFQYTIFWAVAFWRDHDSGIWSGWRNPVAWAVLAYSVVGPGCVADVLQQKGQGLVTASESSLFLAIEPVSTAVLSRFILGEETSWLEKIGGACLVLGTVIASQSDAES